MSSDKVSLLYESGVDGDAPLVGHILDALVDNPGLLPGDGEEDIQGDGEVSIVHGQHILEEHRGTDANLSYERYVWYFVHVASIESDNFFSFYLVASPSCCSPRADKSH